MIEVKNISKKFENKEIFKNLSLNVKQGDRIAILGKNGTGKTTFIKMLLGFLYPDEGNILKNGIDTKDKKFILSDVGYVSSTEIFSNDISVKSFITLIRKIYKDFNFDIDSIAEMFEFDLENKKKIKTLSTGELQKLIMCLCFCVEREIYLFDEATKGLDPFMKRTFLNYLKTFKNKTILYLTHNIDEIKDICDQAYFVKDFALHNQIVPKENFHEWEEMMITKYEK